VCGQELSSVLHTGTWIKIGITSTGAFKLDFAKLRNASPSMAAADPRNLQLFGNGGTSLPQSNAAFRYDDLMQNAIQVIGELDGKFDEGDYILFYGQGTTRVDYDSLSKTFSHELNPYTDTTFYFLTAGAVKGKRMATDLPGQAVPQNPTSTFLNYQFHEVDLVSPLLSGRNWLGEAFQGELTQSRSFTFSVPGRVPDSEVLIRSRLMVSSTSKTNVVMKLNKQDVGFQTVEPVASIIGKYQTKGILNTASYKTILPGKSESLTIDMTSNRISVSNSAGYLDFLSVQCISEIRQPEQATRITVGKGQFLAKNANAALRIWNVTNPVSPSIQSYNLSGNQALWSSDNVARHEYFLFAENQIQIPKSISSVANQNIHEQAVPDLIIVTSTQWLAEAQRLASFRRIRDSLTVLVVTTQQVYNEFASGQPDPTAIRDMCRYFYKNGSKPGSKNRLQYLLLLGDASYDYRNINGLLLDTEQANTIPSYQSRESLNPLGSFSSDDYFGFLKDSDGEWPENFGGDQLLDIGIGRLPVKSTSEAKLVVDKLLNYSDNRENVGDWRSKIMFIGDDGDENAHQEDADLLASFIEKNHPEYQAERVLLDAFPQTTETVGTTVQEKAETVNQLLSGSIQEGRLMVNYNGHGGNNSWAQEQILTLKEIVAFKNARLPLFVTATCEFGRYDDPSSNSGAELLLINAHGAIALLTSTRPVFADKNFILNQAFYKAAFTRSGNEMPRLGDIMRITKNTSISGVQNRNFALLGDPSMMLAFPEANVTVTTVDAKLITKSSPDTLRPLKTIELDGEVRKNGSSTAQANFSGKIQLRLFDKPTSKNTFGTEGSPKMNFQAYESLLYSGEAIVTNGHFKVSFALPLNSDNAVGVGRLFMYAQSETGFSANGGQDFLVGGEAANAPNDHDPPVIALSLEGSANSQAPVTVPGPDVSLIIDVTDNSGINLSQSGDQYAFTAQIDDQKAMYVSKYYQTSSNYLRKGKATLKITGLQNGIHTAKVQVSDLNNNTSQASIIFMVSDKEPMRLSSYVYPNPSTENITITGEHNRTGEAINWVLILYNAKGQILNQTTGLCASCPKSLVIDGTKPGILPNAGLSNGVYFYKLQLLTGDSKTEDGGRIILKR